MSAIFQEVMIKNKIFPDLVPAETPFNYSRRRQIEKSSKRYFVVKGFAKFSCPKHRVWPSAHAWCFIDLKTQSIRHRYRQVCKKCKYSAPPMFDKESLASMAQKGVNDYLSRKGLKKRPRKVKSVRMTHKTPHDRKRCFCCKDKGKKCF